MLLALNQFCPLDGVVPVPGVLAPNTLVPAVLNKVVQLVFCADELPPVLVLVNCILPPALKKCLACSLVGHSTSTWHDNCGDGEPKGADAPQALLKFVVP